MVAAPPRPKNLVPSALVCPADRRSLSPWIGTVADLPGEVGVACIDPQHLLHLLAQLDRDRVGYYWPQEQIVRRYDRVRRAWKRSLFPGTLFVDIGRDDDRSPMNSADDYCRFFGWRLSWMRASNGASQSRLRRDLVNLERLLGSDPELSAMRRILPGQRVRITQGKLIGTEGIVVGDGPQATVIVGVQMLGMGTPLEIARELLEVVE